MAARKLDIVDLNHALSAGLTTGLLLARMVARLMAALTFFFALKGSVHSFWVALGSTTMTAVKPVDACFTATTLRTVLGEVFRFTDLHNLVGVSRATETQRRANGFICAQHTDNVLPHVHSGVRICVSNEKHTMLCSAEENIDAVGRLQEPDVALLVAAYQRYDHNLGFFTLEIVDCRNPQKLRQLLFLERLPSMFCCSCDSLVRRLRLVEFETILFECFLVTLAKHYLEIVTHCST
jgi:hypothetical protein